MSTRTAPTPAVLAPPRGYDRDRWVNAVLASNLQRNQRHLALILAHRAGASGELPAGGKLQEAGHLAGDMHLDPKRVRLVLTELETAGWIRRPDIHTWSPGYMVRPISLVFPAAADAPGADRTEPAHTGQPAS
ncbi:hypothetical protein ACKI10_15215 [Streptomyces galilaeus]|uniref:MarR family transcriptional regulator n=1 Tax=Streptomyces galilaeus TaxID=33899 RepID=A0ABW9IZV1_STRGJ